MRLCSKTIVQEDQLIARKGLLDDPRYGVEVLLLHQDLMEPDATFPLNPLSSNSTWKGISRRYLTAYIALANRLQSATGKVSHVNMQFNFDLLPYDSSLSPEDQLIHLRSFIDDLRDQATMPLALENTVVIDYTISAPKTYRHHYNPITTHPEDAHALGMDLIFDAAHYATALQQWYAMHHDEHVCIGDHSYHIPLTQAEHSLVERLGFSDEAYACNVREACLEVIRTHKPKGFHITNTVAGMTQSTRDLEPRAGVLDLTALSRAMITHVEDPVLIVEHDERDYTNPINQRKELEFLATL